MKHIKIDNVDYVIVRMQKDSKIELVSSLDGSIKYVDPSEIDFAKITHHDRIVIPGALPFAFRPPSFILDLQRRRLELLKENIKLRRSRSASSKSLKSSPRVDKIPKVLQGVPENLRDQVALAMRMRKSR